MPEFLPARIALEDGSVFHGRSFTGRIERCAEIVFNTAMSGYQEILTDPSYLGQMVVMTYPLIGNYGINPEDVESAAERPWVEGLIIRELAPRPSNWRATLSLSDYLSARGVPGIDGIDTRALTLRLREKGALRGCVSTGNEPDAALVEKARAHPMIDGQDMTAFVTRQSRAVYEPAPTQGREALPVRHVAAVDFGMKQNILHLLRSQNLRVTVLPSNATPADVAELKPDCVFLSNGPGDPAAVSKGIALAQAATQEMKLPTFGICLGHQILGLCFGGTTRKLRFGHHGANHPVKNLETGAVEITSQNHNFIVVPESLPESEFALTHVNLNDQSLEGFRHRTLPVLAVQYHPEASPGPHDSHYLFDRFRKQIDSHLS